MPDRYRHNKGSVTSIRYHVIWIPRRRRKALVGDVAKRLIALLREKAAEIDVTMMRLADEPDHIHLFLDCPQHLAISQIVFRLKGYTSRILRKEFEHLRRMPSMWRRLPGLLAREGSSSTGRLLVERRPTNNPANPSPGPRSRLN